MVQLFTPSITDQPRDPIRHRGQLRLAGETRSLLRSMYRAAYALPFPLFMSPLSPDLAHVALFSVEVEIATTEDKYLHRHDPHEAERPPFWVFSGGCRPARDFISTWGDVRGDD